MEWSTFVAKAADSYELVENAEVNDLLYFVDAGDYNTSTVPEGEKLGLLNSRTDQLYGEDATTCLLYTSAVLCERGYFLGQGRCQHECKLRKQRSSHEIHQPVL